MLGNVHYDHLRDLFAAQFTQQDGAVLHRRNRTGAGYVVSPAERDAFVAGYGRQTRRLMWYVAAGVVLLIGTVVMLFDSPDKSAAIALTTALIALLTLSHVRAWHAPSRGLGRRVPSFPALDRAAAKRATLSQVTWGNLALVPVFAGFLALKSFEGDDGPRGWRAMWLAAAVILLLAGAVQAWRKWRIERRG